MRPILRLFTCLTASVAALGAVPGYAGSSGYRFVSPQLERAETAALATFGPFIVIDQHTAALVDVTDNASPRQFARLLEAYPSMTALSFIESPGTFDDEANLQLGRMIRAAGLTTLVPKGGSVRSGGVELFLAGAARIMADDAEFAVLAWLDDSGHSAQDYADSAPENRKYLDYYREMGMDAAQAASFYAMTNSVPFEDALWLSGTDMQRWIGPAEPAPETADTAIGPPQLPRLAYLDLEPALN